MKLDKKLDNIQKTDEDIVLEQAVADLSNPGDKKDKPGVLKNKKVVKIVDVLVAEKKSLIIIGVLIILIFVVTGLANMIVYNENDSLFRGSLKQLNNEYNKLMNDIDTFQKTNPYYTGVDISEVENAQKDVNWIGVKYDAGRVKSDTQFFWDWVSPAFDYQSAEEYNANIKEFTSTKGLPKDNLFVTTFLQPYDYKSVEAADTNNDGQVSANEIEMANRNYKGYTNKNVYADWARLIGTTQSGDYHYMVMVPWATSSDSKYYTMILFTFTAKHSFNEANNTDTISITDFNVWPPNSKQLTRIAR